MENMITACGAKGGETLGRVGVETESFLV